MYRYYEKDLSAKQYKKGTNSWFQGQDAYQWRYQGFETKKGQRPKTVNSLIITKLFETIYVFMGSFSFPKNERLLNRKDFVNLNRLGKRYHTAHFIINFKENSLGIIRLGITVSKKTGNAVTRNRIKRYIREFFRSNKTYFPQGHDIVIIAKKGAGNLDYWNCNEELSGFFSDKELPPKY